MELTERLRQTLLMVVALLALICFFSSFMLFCCAAYIKVNVDARMKLIETYNSDVLPAIFLFVGVINLAQNLTCLFVCLKMRNIDNREGLMRMLFPVLIGGIILVIFEVSTAIASFVHISILDDEFEAGLKKAMSEYVNGEELKVEMDTVQSEYGCCGDVDYTQWFEYSWLDPQYLKASSKGAKKYFQTDGKYYSDDTPFSCCDVRSPRPCIHHHVNDNSKHHNYNYEVETTLYVRGCRLVLMEIYSGVLCTVAVIALLIAAVKTTALLLFRLLQTSLVAAQAADDWEATTPAYIYYLKVPDQDLEQKKLLDSASDSEGASGSGGSKSYSGSGTDENTNNETEYDDDDTEAAYHSNRNYQNHTGDIENFSHNRHTWQPLSFTSVTPGTGYLQGNNMRHLSHVDDLTLQNGWSKQPGAFQSGGFATENHSDPYNQGHTGNDNSSSYNENKHTDVPNSDTDPYKVWTERNMFGSDQRLLPTQGMSEIESNGKDIESADTSVPSDTGVMSSEASGKQVKFEPQKLRPSGDHQGFAGKLLSRLASSLQSKKYRDSSNSYTYSRVRTSSDSDEQEDEGGGDDAEEAEDSDEEEEEEEAEDEDKEICSFEEGCGKHSDWDTKNKRYTRPCITRNTAEELGSAINSAINNNVKSRTSETVPARDKERYPNSNNIVYSQEYYQRRLTDTPCGSDVPVDARTDVVSSTSRVSVSSYHEVNEVSGECKVKHLKQRHRDRRIMLEADSRSASKHILGTRDTKPAEQKPVSKSVSFVSTVVPAEVNVVNSQGHKGSHKSTSSTILENRSHGQTQSQHRNYNPSTGWLNPSNNFRAPSDVEQKDTHRADHTKQNVHWPKYTCLAEVAGTTESSETDYEAASNESEDYNSSHRRRFVARYTPYPNETMRHNPINSEDYDFIPTNIRQSKESTSNDPLKKLPRETSDIAELSNTDVPESDTEMSQLMAAEATSECPDHCRRNQQVEESRYMSHTQLFSKHDLQRAKPPSQMTAGKTDTPDISQYSRRGLPAAQYGQEHGEHVSISRTYTDCVDSTKHVPLELKSVTKQFAFPLMQPSPSSFEMSSSVRNHIRSYQRRSVFLASPLSHSRTNSPINSSSPHLALFSSPQLDSPMETSTPILCTKRMLDSFKYQTLSTAARDNSSIQPAHQKTQEATRSDPVPRSDSSRHVRVDDVNKRQGSLSDLFPTMAGTEKQSMAASQQLMAMEGALLIDEVFTSTEVCDVVHNVTTTEHSLSQGRVLISPFN